MKKALIVYGGWEGHDPKGVADVFKEILEGEDFSVELSDTLEVFMEDLSVYDLIIPCWTMGNLTGDQEWRVCEAVASGVGIAGCHGGMCDAFRGNTNWQFMTGAQWVAHPGNGEVVSRVSMKKSASSPLIDGIEDFDIKGEQYYIHVDPAVNVLATTRFPTAEGHHVTNGEVDIPVAFTKRWGEGKVYYNSLGHDRYTFDVPQVKEMMRRGFLWAAR